MKRHLVVTSSTIVRPSLTVELDAAVEAASAGERARLQAYLYGSSTLAAVVHEVEPYGEGTKRVTQRALVTVQGNDPADARFLADYQAGRLQSGSFGVEDFVQDEQAARAAVGIDDTPKPQALDAVLRDFSTTLVLEEVMGSLALDSDSLEHSYTRDALTGEDRPRTEADLRADVEAHEVAADALELAAELLRGYTIGRCDGSLSSLEDDDDVAWGSKVECVECHRNLYVTHDTGWRVPNHAVILDRP